jgi:(p)ppGpp synthase/HD superfamily hydrolase
MAASPRIDDVAERSDLVRRALAFARDAHAGQVRWTGGEKIAFIDHPLAVATQLAEAGFDETAIAAALLHDTVEHADADPGELRGRFGDEVADLVESLTEDAGIESLEGRKADLRRRVVEAGPEARAIFAADKAANVAVLREAYGVEGERVDANLPVPLDDKIVVWRQDLEALSEAKEDGAPVVERLADELAGLWDQRAAEGRSAGADASSV